ncbi:beta-galactosidase [Saccharibacillus sp. CPCC 101409]|uniref:beta-galactosidase n=1 Tax=Saccharibacillus sp. CPCC 101409 TaxID=3058041 RepID=UPI002672B8DD|nr:beta-galactosidase [Saccharibacillus sp. CPCC 101409]MDO3413182.1 beta-galactosidase [Saccharibacillus sp. CPCC 101409]
MERLHYGVAYYDEYMPHDRLDKDIEMMKAAGITVVRIAESTWSTHEPQNGVFDFASVDRVLDAMHAAGISVIVGTPTYAVPTWMVREHPEVLAETRTGPGKYGARQIMDITSPAYLFYAERIIRKLIGRVCGHPAVIGYQIDNETKHYGTAGPNVQLRFIKYMREKFGGDPGELNRRFGLDYWSNRIDAWEDFPSVLGTINGSLGAEFARFQRKLVTDFLAWQAEIVGEYKKPGQFTTHNFDFDWRGHSYGVQRDVDHFAAARALDVVGVDIYHPSQSELTGAEISFGGDLARSLKRSNYLVLETQAQAFPHWTPYPGQLRLLAFSHLASGANMVSYWHWHSIHNSFETYWKGLLSHDLQPNPVYNEAKTIGADFARLSESLIGLHRTNRVALLVSNESLSALDWFPLPGGVTYNDVVRRCYDALYKLNVGCDFLGPETSSAVFDEYDLIVVPALYSAPERLLEKLNAFVERGGHIVYTFKSGFTNEDVQVRTSAQPGVIERICGVRYQLFAEPKNVSLQGDPFGAGEQAGAVGTWMELLTPTTAEVLARYDHPEWNEYAAITRSRFGEGTATYIGFLPTEQLLIGLFAQLLQSAGLWSAEQKLAFPLIVKCGINRAGRKIRYFLNYSGEEAEFEYAYADGRELVSGEDIRHGQSLTLPGWGFAVVEDRESAACSVAETEDGAASD